MTSTMMSSSAGHGPPAPPPYFDEEDMLEDYIDDDDFGGPPPPPFDEAAATITTTTAATNPSTTQPASSSSNNNDQYDEDYWENMMELDGMRNQNQESATTTTDSTSAAATRNPEPTAAPEPFESNNTEHEKENAIETNTGNNSNNNNNTVEEYLAARRQDNQLYSFERYKKHRDWRTTASSSLANQQQQQQHSQRRQRLLASTRLLSKTRNASKTVAPEARFLRLLEANHRGGASTFYEKYHRGPTRLRLDPSSSDRTSVFRSPPSALATVPLTLADGSRVYIRSKQSSRSTRDQTAVVATHGSESSCALGVSMKELFRRVDGMRRSRIAAGLRPERDSSEPSRRRRSDDRLWVDKHAPRAFPHLLSDERTNREVLRALRGWDPYVFRRAPPLRPLYQRLREQQEQPKDEANPAKSGSESKPGDPAKSSDKRPEENSRVILLSGPPGVGKTTLAHIVARHAGYRPVEVNASDERSSGVLKDRIQRAMESKTINFKPNSNSNNDEDDYGKPNCLILDEIDGADARGSIQALVDIVKAEIPSKANKQKQSSKAATYLRRPIICICNHKYAPALRPLLPYAVHFNVEPPSSSRLVARLKAILNEENMPLLGGGSLLHQLVVSSGGDIRSCLFTLQFAAAESKDGKDLSEALTNSLSGTGLKDNRNDISSTISTVFRKTKAGQKQFSSSSSLSSSKSKDSSVSRVMNAVDSLGDDSAAVNALFMNVLRVSYIDPAFDRCSAAHELLSFAAVANNHYSGYAAPVVTAGIHLLCRVEVKPNLTVSSRELADIKYRRESNLGLVQKFCEGLPTRAKNLKCNSLLAKEFIPMVMWILSAGDGHASLSRAASSIDILSTKEQDAAKKHVEALCALGLTYTVNREEQEKRREVPSHLTEEMRMEPPIYKLVEYSALYQPGGLRRHDIPSKMKELLAHEVHLEKFRSRESTTLESPREDEASSDTGASKASENKQTKTSRNAGSLPSPAKATPKKSEKPATNVKSPATKSTPSPTASNFLGIAARKGKAAKSARRAAALGLNRVASKKQKLAHSGSGLLLSHVIRMKYVKGFTQAVRTPCRLQDLE